jgi:hypothetical protein
MSTQLITAVAAQLNYKICDFDANLARRIEVLERSIQYPK